MNDIPRGRSAHLDEMADVVRRLHALHGVMCDVTTGDDDLDKVFSDAERAVTSPVQRILVAYDIEGPTTRSLRVQAALRADMHRLIAEALLHCKIVEGLREPIHYTGSGVVRLVHPAGMAHQNLLHAFVPTLGEKLAELQPDRMFRLRVAIHTGAVHFAGRHISGPDIDVALGLLNAPELHSRLRKSATPFVLVVSDRFRRSVIRGDEQTFEPIGIAVAGQPHIGWVQVLEARQENTHANRTA